MPQSTKHPAPSTSLPSDVVLSVRAVSKKFCRNLRRSMRYGVRDLGFNLLGASQNTTTLRQDEFWALQDVSFDLHRGQFLGIVGSNGAGKSTLLRLVAGIFPPDSGEVHMRGRVGALIALGAGFHPHMTGRENIFLNGAILGMDRVYIQSRFHQIVQFAEIGDFLDAPVATYSSGMRVRLGFAVAVHMAPDLLLVDEVLSVGDASFRERCYNHMTDYKSRGGTVIFISHNTLAVEEVCNRALWMESGRIIDSGEPARIVEAYELKMLEKSEGGHVPAGVGSDAPAVERVHFDAVTCLAADGQPRDSFAFGESIRFRLHYRIVEPAPMPSFFLGIKRSGGEDFLSAMGTQWRGLDLSNLPPQGVVDCLVESPRLAPGAYVLYAGVQGAVSGKLGEKWHTPLRERLSFIVGPGNLRQELPHLPGSQLVRGLPPMVQQHQWALNGQPIAPT